MSLKTHIPRIVGALCFAFSCLLVAPTVRAATNTIIFDLANFGADAVAFKQVRIEPVTPASFPRVEGDTVIGADYGFKVTDSGGRLTNSMVTGTYKITFTNRFRATTFEITVPSTNASAALYAAALTTSGTNAPGNLVAYSQVVADLRFPSIAGTNILFVTNNGRITIHGTATGSGGGGDGDAGGTNARQFGSLNLTNWSNIPTGAMANIPAVSFLTNWANAISNLVGIASSNRVQLAGGSGGITVSQSGSGGIQTWTINDDDAGSGGSDAGGTNSRQFGSLNLTNWSNIPTGSMANIPAMTWATNRINAALTNNHSAVATVSGFNVATLTNAGATLLQGTVAFSDSGFTGTDTVIKRNGNSSALTTATMSVSSASNLSGIHNITSAGTNTARAFQGSGTAPGTLQIDHVYANTNLHGGAIVATNSITLNAATASRLAAFNASKELVSSTYSETDIANLQGGTNGLDSRASSLETQTNSLSSRINTQFSTLSNYTDTASSNRVRVAAGTGGITVTPSGSGGVMTFTIDDDDAGGGGGGLTAAQATNIVTAIAVNPGDFTWAILPDTQTYTSGDPTNFYNGMQFLRTNATAMNLRALVGLGDIVQDGGNLTQWGVAKIGYGIVSSNVPNVVIMPALGNHDYDDSGTTFINTRAATNYINQFSNLVYTNAGWNGAQFGASNHFENSFVIQTNAGKAYGILMLEFGPRTNVMDWAASVVASNAMVSWFIVTHSYMYRDDSRVGDSDLYNPRVYQCCTNSADGEAMWSGWIKNMPNVVAVFSGHDLADGQGRLAEAGTFKNVISQYLFNYQANTTVGDSGGTDDAGLSGTIQLMTFRPSLGLVEVRSYSPAYNTTNSTSTYQFAFPLNLVDNRPSASASGSRRVEDFIFSAATGWDTITANGGSISWGVAPTSGGGGLLGWVFMGGSTSNMVAGVKVSESAAYFGAGTMELHVRLQTPVLSTTDDKHELIVGYGDSTTGAEPTDGAYFFYTHDFFGGNWGAKTSAGGSKTSVTNGTPVAVTGSSTWDLKIVATASLVTFYVSSDGGTTYSEIGSTASTIPDDSGEVFGVQVYLEKVGGSVGSSFRGLYVERVEF